MRPSVALPTGTWMGEAVLVTGVPRARPSVVSMAMQRTVFSPRCCATSMTRLSFSLEMVALVTLSAVYTSGRPPGGNSTSTTGPRTWVTRPVVGTFALIVVVAPGSAEGERWGWRALSTDPPGPGQGPSEQAMAGVVRRISGACRCPGQEHGHFVGAPATQGESLPSSPVKALPLAIAVFAALAAACWYVLRLREVPARLRAEGRALRERAERLTARNTELSRLLQ